ncbi:MAG: phosphodiesterase, partial [Acidobacteria bacterium]|nr:phosphodiesterase [Acidobacteriota bacterium]
LEALDATLRAAGSYDRVLVLGDLVGYGADPNAVIDRVRALPNADIVRGNHDKVGAGLDGVQGFNHLARQAIQWTATALTVENRAWLATLPQGPAIVDDLTEMCHGTPFDEDVYVFDDMDALRSLHVARRSLCLFGHTHVPAIFTLVESGPSDTHPRARAGRELDVTAPVRGSLFRLDLDGESRYLVNCGAVGQPRDGDPRASWGLLDTDGRSLTITRTPYDIAAAQAKIVKAGLPGVLAQRLAVGR